MGSNFLGWTAIRENLTREISSIVQYIMHGHAWQCTHPRKLNLENFEDWPSAKTGPTLLCDQSPVAQYLTRIQNVLGSNPGFDPEIFFFLSFLTFQSPVYNTCLTRLTLIITNYNVCSNCTVDVYTIGWSNDNCRAVVFFTKLVSRKWKGNSVASNYM